MEMAIFNEECARVRAPGALNSLAMSQVGPTIIQHGTEAQKRRYLPAIVNADEIWCQGFSEPNAGSDLSSLRTRAELVGDEFIVNGQKIWTSYAQYAALVLPDGPHRSRRPQASRDQLSAGRHEEPRDHGQTAQARCTAARISTKSFFENVHVPRENLLGTLNDGWRVSMTTLANERGTSALSQYVRYEQIFNDLVQLARTTRPKTASPRLRIAMVRQELARHYVDLQGLQIRLLPGVFDHHQRRHSGRRRVDSQVAVVRA